MGLCGASRALLCIPAGLTPDAKAIKMPAKSVLNYSAIKAKDKLPAAPACD